MEEFQNETFDEVYTYRGVSVEIWNDDYGQQRFLHCVDHPLFGTQDIGLGSYNIEYKQDIEYLIDKELDTIYVFNTPETFGARLEYFFNDGYRDIKLTYRSRLLKVFLVDKEPAETQLQAIITAATLALHKYLSMHIEK